VRGRDNPCRLRSTPRRKRCAAASASAVRRAARRRGMSRPIGCVAPNPLKLPRYADSHPRHHVCAPCTLHAAMRARHVAMPDPCLHDAKPPMRERAACSPATRGHQQGPRDLLDLLGLQGCAGEHLRRWGRVGCERERNYCTRGSTRSPLPYIIHWAWAHRRMGGSRQGGAGLSMRMHHIRNFSLALPG
jgi:hypothetical protein